MPVQTIMLKNPLDKAFNSRGKGTVLWCQECNEWPTAVRVDCQSGNFGYFQVWVAKINLGIGFAQNFDDRFRSEIDRQFGSFLTECDTIDPVPNPGSR